MLTVFVFFAGNERGGAAAHIVTLARTVVHTDTHHRYQFVSLGEGPLATAVSATGVHHQMVPASAIGAMQALARLVRNKRQVMLHAHGPRMNILAALVARRARIPWTSTIHSHPLYDFLGSSLKSRVYPKLHFWSLRQAIGLFVVQPALADVLPTKTALDVPNSLEMPKLAEPREHYAARWRDRLDLPASAKLIGIAARFDPVKNIDVLIHAMPHLTSSDTHLLLAGDGEMRMALEALVDELGLRQRVHFLGFLADMPSFYAGLHLHILPSKNEGTPFSVLEAGSCGTANVASDVPGLRSLLLDGRAGVLVPVGDATALAKAIDAVLQDTEMQQAYVETFRDDVLPHFAPKKMLEAYERGYTVLEEDILRSRRY